MKILALDGGGVFGRAQSQILTEANCFEKFDMYVGTSIGAPQCIAHALGLHQSVTPEFFDKWMPKVFKTSFLRKFNIFKSQYPDDGLNNALQEIFGSSRFGDVKKPVFVTAADIGQKTLKVFSSKSFDDASIPAWEVCRAACAAETYFPPWKGIADGGIYANNPSFVGLAAAVRMLGEKLEDIEILSIGTGDNSGDAGDPPSNRLSWAIWVLRAMLNGSSDKMHDYFVKSMSIKKYKRIQFVCDPGWRMDDPRSMYLATRKWSSDIRNAVDVVKEF